LQFNAAIAKLTDMGDFCLNDTISGSILLESFDYPENMWDISGEASDNDCDIYGVCGIIAICTNNKSSICDCSKGFVPMSNEEWSKSNWTRGCVRRSEKNQSSLASGKVPGSKRAEAPISSSLFSRQNANTGARVTAQHWSQRYGLDRRPH
nr:G-type lectin S-receptor-like serine/threonine-protein kinase [Tanacetum cinerariifolium]